MFRIPTKVAAVAAATVTALSLTATPAAAAPGSFTAEGVRIYRHADFQSDVLGLGYPSHSVNVRCVVYRQYYMSMYYLTNNSTGVTGWVPTEYVRAGDVPGC
ncbi:hypothetical protein ACFV4I_04135 [Nocardiopsis alba]|uniref:hypothetical protein n=1 Tax=Nocardiopsis alba TaxID=53437 RepID=UPI0036595F39